MRRGRRRRRGQGRGGPAVCAARNLQVMRDCKWQYEGLRVMAGDKSTPCRISRPLPGDDLLCYIDSTAATVPVPLSQFN